MSSTNAKEILKEWFILNLAFQYASSKQKQILSVKTKLNSKQIENWLKKERLKYNKNHVI